MSFALYSMEVLCCPGSYLYDDSVALDRPRGSIGCCNSILSFRRL